VRIPLKKLPQLLRDLLIPLQVGQVDGVSADRVLLRNRPPTTHPRTSLARFGARTQEEDRLERSQSRAWPRPPAPPRPRSQSWTWTSYAPWPHAPPRKKKEVEAVHGPRPHMHAPAPPAPGPVVTLAAPPAPWAGHF